jgi:hypothetical protein
MSVSNTGINAVEDSLDLVCLWAKDASKQGALMLIDSW